MRLPQFMWILSYTDSWNANVCLALAQWWTIWIVPIQNKGLLCTYISLIRNNEMYKWLMLLLLFDVRLNTSTEWKFLTDYCDLWQSLAYMLISFPTAQYAEMKIAHLLGKSSNDCNSLWCREWLGVRVSMMPVELVCSTYFLHSDKTASHIFPSTDGRFRWIKALLEAVGGIIRCPRSHAPLPCSSGSPLQYVPIYIHRLILLNSPKVSHWQSNLWLCHHDFRCRSAQLWCWLAPFAHRTKHTPTQLSVRYVCMYLLLCVCQIHTTVWRQITRNQIMIHIQCFMWHCQSILGKVSTICHTLSACVKAISLCGPSYPSTHTHMMIFCS